MKSLEILSREWLLFLIFIIMFVSGLVIAELFYRLKREKATKLGEKLDGLRDVHIRLIRKNLTKSFGILRIILLIFAMNLFGGALIWSSIGGLLVVVPFFYYFLIGFLTNLVLKRYPERINWLTFPNIFFEVAAFMVAAIGAVNIGLSIFGPTNLLTALKEWALLFITVVVPLQIIAAIFEGFLFNKIFIVQKNPWPRGTSENE